MVRYLGKQKKKKKKKKHNTEEVKRERYRQECNTSFKRSRVKAINQDWRSKAPQLGHPGGGGRKGAVLASKEKKKRKS